MRQVIVPRPARLEQAILMATVACLLLIACAGGQPSTPKPAPDRSAAATLSVATAHADASQATSAGASARVFYVAAEEAGASDTNNGRYSTFKGGQDGPWRTIGQAARSLKAGDTAYVRQGTYFETAILLIGQASAAPGLRTTLASYAGEKVVVDGSRGKAGDPGIGIRGAGFVVQGFTIRNMPGSGIVTDPEVAERNRDLVIRDCLLHNNGRSGLELAAVDGFLVENVEAHDNAYYGMNVTASKNGALSSANGAINNSRFYNHTGKQGHGLAINQGNDITVSDSQAYHNRIHGFDASDWPKGGAVSYNLVFQRNFAADNGHAGFSINSHSHHVTYRNNVAWRNGADWAKEGSSSGFLCYQGCWQVEWLNNASLQNSDAGFWIQDPGAVANRPAENRLVFKNNVTYENGRPEWDKRPALVVEGKNTWQVTASHNNWNVPSGGKLAVYDQGRAYSAEEIKAGAFPAGNVLLEPRFADAAAPDLRLANGSPMVDAGEAVGLPFCGTAPDIGPFEQCP